MSVNDLRREQDYVFVSLSALANSLQTIVAAVAGKKIRVISLQMNTIVPASGEGALIWMSGAGTSTLATFRVGSGENAISHAGPVPCFETVAGEELSVQNATSVDTIGALTYVLVS